MLRTRLFAAVQALCAVLALVSSFTGVVTDPPIFAGAPIWSMYRLVQVVGLVGSVLLGSRLRGGASLSVVFWAVQLFGLQGRTFRLLVGSALTLPLSLSIAPGTVTDVNPPSYVVYFNLVPVIALWVLAWVLKHEPVRQEDAPSPAV
jgi:hypothetical protein